MAINTFVMSGARCTRNGIGRSCLMLNCAAISPADFATHQNGEHSSAEFNRNRSAVTHRMRTEHHELFDEYVRRVGGRLSAHRNVAVLGHFHSCKRAHNVIRNGVAMYVDMQSDTYCGRGSEKEKAPSEWRWRRRS